MTAPPFYLAASDGLPQTTDLGHQHRQGEGTPTESSDPIRYLPHKPPTLSKGLHFSLKKIFFVKQETIGLRGTEMQKSLSKESSRPKVRAQKNPAPGWVPGILGGAAQSPEFLATDKAPPFPIRLQPIRFCQGWLSNLPLLRSSCRWLLSGPSVRSVPGQECWWPSPGPARRRPRGQAEGAPRLRRQLPWEAWAQPGSASAAARPSPFPHGAASPPAPEAGHKSWPRGHPAPAHVPRRLAPGSPPSLSPPPPSAARSPITGGRGERLLFKRPRKLRHPHWRVPCTCLPPPRSATLSSSRVLGPASCPQAGGGSGKEVEGIEFP